MAPAPDLVANREVGRAIFEDVSFVWKSIQDVVDALGIGLDEAGEVRNSSLTTLLVSTGVYSKNT